MNRNNIKGRDIFNEFIKTVNKSSSRDLLLNNSISILNNSCINCLNNGIFTWNLIINKEYYCVLCLYELNRVYLYYYYFFVFGLFLFYIIVLNTSVCLFSRANLFIAYYILYFRSSPKNIVLFFYYNIIKKLQKFLIFHR